MFKYIAEKYNETNCIYRQKIYSKKFYVQKTKKKNEKKQNAGINNKNRSFKICVQIYKI